MIRARRRLPPSGAFASSGGAPPSQEQARSLRSQPLRPSRENGLQGNLGILKTASGLYDLRQRTPLLRKEIVQMPVDEGGPVPVLHQATPLLHTT